MDDEQRTSPARACSGGTRWTLLVAGGFAVVAACSREPPRVEAARDAAPAVAPDAAAASRDAGPGTAAAACQPRGQVPVSVETVGAGVIACFARDTSQGREQPRTCWSIDRTEPARAVAPPPLRPPSASDTETTLLLPPGWTATKLAGTVGRDEDAVVGVRVCDPQGACHQLRFAPSRHRSELDDSVAGIAVAPGGQLAYVDRGAPSMSPSRIELYSLRTDRQVRVLGIPGQPCSNLIRFLGQDRLLLQGFDCANWVGPYALMTLDGRRLATITSYDGQGFGFDHPGFPLGGELWGFAQYDGSDYYVVVIDARDGKRRSARSLTSPGHPPDPKAEISGAPGFVVVVDSDGRTRRFAPDLQPLDTIQIPMCP